MTTVYAKVQMRRDTAANWAAANPVLAEGEVGYITDTKAEKIGDGVTAWNDLLSRPSLEQLTDAKNAAQTAAADAGQRLTATVAAQTATETARDETQTLRDQTYDYKADVASAIVYQDLASIAEQKALTMVAGFVYDTRLDTDGGAWRDRCHGTSWYNEQLNTPTRGSRRDMPSLVVPIAEASKVTLCDGDDPSAPMWRVIDLTGLTVKSVAMMSGKLTIATTTGLIVQDYAADDLPVAPNYTTTSTPAIVSNAVNSVAMTVLPDAPVDPDTGLQVPTIAVATDGGVSVIKHDGTVIDFTNSNSGFTYSGSVALKPSGEITFSMGASASSNQVTYVFDRIPAADNLITYNSKNGSVLNAVAIYTLSSSLTSDFAPTPAQPFSSNQQFDHVDGAVATKVGLVSLGIDNSSPARSMFALTSSTFLTGWLPGDIRGAFLASTDQTDLVASGELVTNGTFDADVSGWSAGGGASIAWGSAGEIQITSASGFAYAYQSFPTIAGRTYKVRVNTTNSGTAHYLYVGNSAGSNNIVNKQLGVAIASYDCDFVATGNTTFVSLGAYNGTANYDGVSVQLSDDDRSVKNQGLIVRGTMPRAPVATGAELVGYGPFSATNYLEQPYNADLDFGTGDFCVMGWVNPSAAGTETIIDARDTGYTEGFYAFLSSGVITFGTRAASLKSENTYGSIPAGVWKHLAFVVSVAGTLHSVYVDGVLIAANTVAARSIGGSDSPCRIGIGYTGINPFGGYLALMRISGSAPSAHQIAKIHSDEKHLFQENAACTLYGTSDAVTALAHDPVTGLLHAGTSAGRSDFDGLLRVGNTTTPVAKAIAASGGMILEG